MRNKGHCVECDRVNVFGKTWGLRTLIRAEVGDEPLMELFQSKLRAIYSYCFCSKKCADVFSDKLYRASNERSN